VNRYAITVVVRADDESTARYIIEHQCQWDEVVAIGQPEFLEEEPEPTTPGDAARRAYNALSVVALDPRIRAYLVKFDPKALAQVEAARGYQCDRCADLAERGW